MVRLRFVEPGKPGFFIEAAQRLVDDGRNAQGLGIGARVYRAREWERPRKLRAAGLVLDVVDHHAVERQAGEARGKLAGGRGYFIGGRAGARRRRAVQRNRLPRVKQL